MLLPSDSPKLTSPLFFCPSFPNLKHQMSTLQIPFHFIKAQIYIVTIMFIFLATTVLSVDPKFEACTPRSCGNGQIIKYPFWIPYEQEPFCGYPHFQITCKDKNPILTTSTYEFLVKDISYSNSSFTATNIAVYEDKCPAPTYNYSLHQTPYTFSSENFNLSFFYNCTTEPVDYPTYKVECPKNATHHSFAVFHKEALEHNNYSLNECQFMVNVPVAMNAAVNFTSLLRMNYTEILKMGFLLKWTLSDCQYCERSGGRCGFEDFKFFCYCKDKPYLKSCGDDSWNWRAKLGIDSRNWRAKLGIGIIVPAIVGLLICITICCLRCKPLAPQAKFWLLTKNNQDIEAFLKNHGDLALQRYKFSDVKKMTNSFKVKLGQGGFGSVYNGKLLNGCPVAVKILNASKGNGEEFINEVASISRTSHINVVTLLGFCFEGRKKALVYEYMSNGSLDKFIYKKFQDTAPTLNWENLFQIAIGIARGLEYLHWGCKTRILHFDIKPHNILLDENFCPKISDFGLAKLCLGKESIISMSDARGTMGYVAPELWNRNFGGVSHKSDVYSYGMMLLEMVGGRKNINAEASHTSEIYFPNWVYNRLELDTDLRIDRVVVVSEENEIVKRMIVVGLWCIQTFPNDRPPMSKVIEMLEGNMDSLKMPPKPVLSSPTRSVDESSTTLN